MSLSLFIDTSAFIALESATDTMHDKAIETRARLIKQGYRPVTSNFVLDETYTFFRKSYQARVRIVRAIRESPLVRYVPVTEQDETAAIEMGARWRDKALSFTDLTSFALIDRLGIRHVFAFDDDFRQHGRLIVFP